jgi:DNA-binding transcriptional ArsR family regulator
MTGIQDPVASDPRYPAPPIDEIRITEILKVLGDSGRVRILEAIADGEYHAGTVEEFGLTVHKSTMSHHLKVMREAGLTTTHLDGRNCFIRLRKAELDERFPGLIDGLTSASVAADLRNSELQHTEA